MLKHPVRNAILFLLLCLLALLSLSCFHTIKIPASAVDRITVSGQGAREDDKTLSVISSPADIAKVLAFLDARKRWWQSSWNVSPAPTPRYSVDFESKGEFQFVVWIGSGWIAFHAAGGESRAQLERNISQEEHLELLRLLGIEPSATTSPAP